MDNLQAIFDKASEGIQNDFADKLKLKSRLSAIDTSAESYVKNNMANISDVASSIISGKILGDGLEGKMTDELKQKLLNQLKESALNQLKKVKEKFYSAQQIEEPEVVVKTVEVTNED